MHFFAMKPADTKSTLFDPSLTPHNARKRGYEYIDDIIYDLVNPNETIKDILEFLREFQGKLGTPSRNDLDSYFGLYVPRQETS